METVYYNLDARRVSTCEMASGETAPQCRSYTVLRKVERKRADQGGKVLDLTAYRRKLAVEQEAEEGWDEDQHQEPKAPAVAASVQAVPRRTRFFGLTLEAFATVSILVMVIVVVTAFLPFL